MTLDEHAYFEDGGCDRLSDTMRKLFIGEDNCNV